ncbi:FlaD/FlaE family flagellar protein [Halorarum salinum]|uniref:Archaeal flagella protein FlaD/E domain-containing protein n=1 Tax=Halorarum salinum TaxID=2743089 RepID=A0A7D5LD58_9EURY|nr:FlaD/FlaE family flagellar protein [Halobaculum salinum]QLG63587.1 hypothetical protein HUG12_18385 [Halobaculum salinum]
MLNPKDYDRTELRALAGATAPPRDGPAEDRWATPDDFLVGADARVRQGQLEDAFVLAAAGDGAVRPYLTGLPDSGVGTRLALDWLRFLVTVGGREGAREALAYYGRVDWLGADAEEALATHLEAFSGGESRPLGPGHHRTSLLFLARLAALR